jgi:hypothetical protein
MMPKPTDPQVGRPVLSPADTPLAAPSANEPDIDKADVKKLGYIGRQPTQKPRDADSWFTPPLYLDSVRAVMGGIDLDPFTTETANQIVKAKWIFTPKNSAFEQDWNLGAGIRVFMNPPYSAGLCAQAVNRFVQQYTLGHFAEGIVLVNNATDTRWFLTLVSHCRALCFTDHRISFWNADRKHVSGNTRGQAFFYFGSGILRFQTVFRQHGFIVVPASPMSNPDDPS